MASSHRHNLAGLAAHAIQGNYTYFGTTSTSLGSSIGWFAVIICGVRAGFAGGLFLAHSDCGSDGWEDIGRSTRSHPIAFAATCGIAWQVSA